MEDIVVKMMKEVNGKDMFYREACLGGVLAGFAVQKQLIMAGKVVYDGSFVAMIKDLSDKPVPVVLRSLGGVYESQLYESMFVGWRTKDKYKREYFTYFGLGMLWVSKLYKEFTLAKIGWPEIMAKVTAVVDVRSSELKKLL